MAWRFGDNLPESVILTHGIVIEHQWVCPFRIQSKDSTYTNALRLLFRIVWQSLPISPRVLMFGKLFDPQLVRNVIDYLDFDIKCRTRVRDIMGILLLDRKHSWHCVDMSKLIFFQTTDMVVTGLTISEERETVVDFSYPFWEESVGLITLTRPDDQFYLYKPLKPLVWVCFVCTALFVGLAAVGVELKTSSLWSLKGHHAFGHIQESCWYMFGAMWNQGASYETYINLHKRHCVWNHSHPCETTSSG